MSLFGHLALRFGSQPENLATEGLGYVLKKSARARRGLLSSVRSEAHALPNELTFTTQYSSEDQGRPDLAATDDTGELRVLIEAKFWAGFTEHQPVDYLDQLPVGGVLVVVCPNARLGHVWRELLDRLRAAKRDFVEEKTPPDLGRVSVDGKHLVLQSWKRMLNAMRVELSDEPETSADVAQLDGLCARMDSEAFLPVTSEELTSHVYRRVHEFGAIVDDVAATAVAERLASVKGLRSAGANGWYGRYLHLRGVCVLLQVSTWKWHLLGPSPLWLVVRGSSWDADPGIAKKELAAFELAHRGRVREDSENYPAVMIQIPVGAERTEIVMSVLDQLREIGEVIAPLGVAANQLAPPPPDDSR